MTKKKKSLLEIYSSAGASRQKNSKKFWKFHRARLEELDTKKKNKNPKTRNNGDWKK